MGLFGHDNAAVLDGGLPKWVKEGRPTEAGAPPAPEPATFRADYRAARLRGIGAERIARHLAEMQGRIVRLLMERPDQGRTEGFALTRLSAQARPGEIISARITGSDAAGLLAEAA